MAESWIFCKTKPYGIYNWWVHILELLILEYDWINSKT